MKNCTNYILDHQAEQEKKVFIRQRIARLNYFFDLLKEGYVQAFAGAGYIVDVENRKVTIRGDEDCND